MAIINTTYGSVGSSVFMSVSGTALIINSNSSTPVVPPSPDDPTQPDTPVDPDFPGPADLPSEYRYAKYLQASGKQYLITDYYCNKSTDIDIRFMNDKASGDSWYALIAAWDYPSNLANSKGFLISVESANTISARYGNQNHRTTITTLENSLTEVKYKDNYLKIDDTVVDLGARTFSDATMSYPMSVFARSFESAEFAPAGLAKCKIYGLEIKENDNIVFSIYPAVRKSDYKPGFYDKISGGFYTNLGEGEFGYELANGTYVAPV